MERLRKYLCERVVTSVTDACCGLSKEEKEIKD